MDSKSKIFDMIRKERKTEHSLKTGLYFWNRKLAGETHADSNFRINYTWSYTRIF